MKYVDVFNQEELDKVIVINEANPDVIPVVRFRGATLRDSSTAVLCDSSSAVLCGSSTAVLCDSSSAVLCGSSTAELLDSSTAELLDSSSAELLDSSSAALWDSSTAVLRDSSTAVLRGSSGAILWDSSSATLWDSSSATLWDSSSAELWGSSSAELWGNAQAFNRTKGSIDTHGNSRIVYNPRTVSEYCDFYGIDLGDTVKLYKAVHKNFDGVYHSDHTYSFVYEVGSDSVADGLTSDECENCERGIHIAHLDWCLKYGSGWSDLAILEVEADASKIIVPMYCDGKVRTDRVKVLREVPLEECGTYGKILARKMQGR